METHSVYGEYIPKYSVTFLLKKERSFCIATKKYEHCICNMLTKDVFSFEQSAPAFLCCFV